MLDYYVLGKSSACWDTNVFIVKLQEAKDCLLGRLFAYGALARSGRLIHEWSNDKNTPYIKEFVGILISLANRKRYLQEPAVSIILYLVEKVCISYAEGVLQSTCSLLIRMPVSHYGVIGFGF